MSNILLVVQKSGQPVEVGSLSHYSKGFLHPSWCRISEPNSMIIFPTKWRAKGHNKVTVFCTNHVPETQFVTLVLLGSEFCWLRAWSQKNRPSWHFQTSSKNYLLLLKWKVCVGLFWLVVSNIFHVHPYLEKWSKLTSIEMGWFNHQLPYPNNPWKNEGF